MKKEIEEHFRRHSNRLVNIAKKRLGFNQALAEEAVQEAYVNALRYKNSFDPETKEFDTWFNTIFNNCVKKTKRAEQSSGISEELLNIETPYVPPGMKDWINKQICLRNKEHQEILNLHYVYGYSVTDIDNIVSLTNSNIHKIINRFKHDVVEKYNVEV